MIRRLRDAPIRGLTCVCASAILLIAAPSLTQAAETEFGYSTGVTELYSGDVFRTGINSDPQDDFITILTLDLGAVWLTPRSASSVNYRPDYRKYATFDSLDNFSHRLTGNWDMTPGPRSAVGIRAGFSLTDQQSGFRDFSGGGGDPNQPITQQTRRLNWDVEPYHRLDINRNWSMQTRAIYRTQQFSNPTLTDVSTTALIYSADRRWGSIRRAGAIVRYGVNYYGRNTSTTVADRPEDRVLNIEATWNQEQGEIFRWSASAGFFQVTGDSRPTSSQPTIRGLASWNLLRSRIQVDYDLGFSSVTGSVGTARSESLGMFFSRRWGVGFTGSATTNYVRFQNLVNDPDERFLDGYSIELSASYQWPTRWGFHFRVRHLTQAQTSGRSLDYFQASVGLTFAPDGPRTRRGGP